MKYHHNWKMQRIIITLISRIFPQVFKVLEVLYCFFWRSTDLFQVNLICRSFWETHASSMKLPYIIGNLLNTRLNPILHPVFRCNHDRSRDRHQSNHLPSSPLRIIVSNRILEQTPTWFKEGTEINRLVEREREREKEEEEEEEEEY